ncbi:MAG: metalloregulator ArsR/SmtB family transcription factor [Gemmatimonadetes bacterium]|nr:metalloregulator ArsR/SmtB family transcription factor [Gemmatimonadota bacterium]
MDKDLAVFKACSDATRLRILFLLTERELCVCEIMAVLDMPQSKISRHLSVLKQYGLLTDRRDGVWIYYALAKDSSIALKYVSVYLVSARQVHERVLADLDRLRGLASQGKICVPHPSMAELQIDDREDPSMHGQPLLSREER